GRVSPPLVFKTSAFSRSAKPPSEMLDVDQSFRLMPFYEGFYLPSCRSEINITITKSKDKLKIKIVGF
ncbi:hypothetical protein, partial [Aeromonas caviae]|uniref:hypothetical protein n=1 Tax=Aeromonas caviae TaxID=648 RepID=UPI00385D7E1B